MTFIIRQQTIYNYKILYLKKLKIIDIIQLNGMLCLQRESWGNAGYY